jgi:F0F1-type ATP synthase assembly protein I
VRRQCSKSLQSDGSRCDESTEIESRLHSPILDSLSLLDVSGHIVVAAIIAVFASALVASIAVRSKYANIERALSREPVDVASHALITMVERECRKASAQRDAPHNVQAIVEQCVQSVLPGYLLGERFVRSSPGLMIILGLIGTFYGLTLSIGRLVRLVTSEAASGGEVAQAVTQGLSHALSGSEERQS